MPLCEYLQKVCVLPRAAFSLVIQKRSLSGGVKSDVELRTCYYLGALVLGACQLKAELMASKIRGKLIILKTTLFLVGSTIFLYKSLAKFTFFKVKIS